MSGQQQLFTINGLVDTNKSVWQNLEALAGASAAYITWDPYTFQYGVVINEPGSSIRSFDDDSIIGAINITETPFDEMYNSAEITFPNKFIRDRRDSIRYEEPVADRFDLEPDNRLDIQFDFVNDPIQADVIAITELKQSRVNKTVAFTTDFQHIDLACGDVIDITNSYYGWDEKLFRVVEIIQTDTVEGQILLDITAVEYDSEVYNYNNLTRASRTVDVGAPMIKNNAEVETSRDETTGTQVGRALATDTGKAAITGGGVPVYDSLDSGFTTTQVDTAINGSSTFGSILNTSTALKNLQIIVEGPQATVDYDVYIDEVSESRSYVGSIPVKITLAHSTDNVTYTNKKEVYKEWTGNSHVFNVTDAAAGYWRVLLEGVDTLVLDQDVPSSITTDQAIVSITNVASSAQPGGDAATISFLLLE